LPVGAQAVCYKVSRHMIRVQNVMNN